MKPHTVELGGGRERGARGRGGQLGGPNGEGVQLGGQEGSVVVPGNLWDSLPTIIGQVQVDGGVLGLQIAVQARKRRRRKLARRRRKLARRRRKLARRRRRRKLG